MNHWYTNPENNIAAAKDKALEQLSKPQPKLTALEKAFWRKYRRDQSALARKNCTNHHGPPKP
jgi:hypothetical protein